MKDYILINGDLEGINVELENINEQLDNIESKKLNKTDIVTMANMGQDVKEAMTGGNVAVVGRYSIGDINLIDDSVTIEKLPMYLKESTVNKIRMINYDNVSNGNIVVNDNNLTMSWTGSNSTIIQIQPFIIEPNTDYFIHFDSTFSNNQIQFEFRNDKNGQNKLVYYISNNQSVFKLVKDTQFIANYIRISGADIDFNGHIWLDMNKDSTYFPPYKSKIVTTDSLAEEIEKLKRELPIIKINKKCLFYGDSITHQDLFQPIIKEVLGINYINDGNPGYPVSSIFENNSEHSFSLSSRYKLNNLVSTINTNNVNYVFIMGGTNDFGYDGTKEPTSEGSFNAITMGDLSYPYNRVTFKGALSTIIDRIQRECATVEKIFVMAPLQRGKEGATDITKNALSLSMLDYKYACEEVANKFSCEFIDVYSCGINFINWEKYIPDKVHPNDRGALLIAHVIIAYLKNMIHV